MSSARAIAGRVRIFPLPSVQLFPHALLPLHVFEPRYRDLVRDCLAEDQVMAVATLEPGYEPDYQGRPPVRRVCGVGELVAHDALPDGRSNILLRGTTRARILEELPPAHAYREVRVELLVDEYPGGLDRASAQKTLVLLADQLALRLPTGGETLRELVRSQAELGALTDVLAAALISEPDERQRLLETFDVGARVDRVSAQMAAILGRFTPSHGPAN
jgi:Lon protease-like protein